LKQVKSRRREAALRKLALLIAAGPGTLLLLVTLLPSMPFLLLRSSCKRRRRVLPNIIRGPVPLINIKYNSRADRLYGYRSDTVVYDVYNINTVEDFDHVVRSKRRSLLGKGITVLSPYMAFLWIVWKYDVFALFYDGGFLACTPLRWLELPLLRSLGKKILVSPYGSDATMLGRSRNRFDLRSAYGADKYVIDERAVERKVRYCCRYANCVLTGGDCVDYISDWDAVFRSVPIDLDGWRPVYKSSSSERIRIVHAPNHRAIKGTQHVIDACEALNREGYAVDLVLVERKPNDEARKLYESADIVAEQFLLGAYGLFAIEAMALGKPVLTYLRDDLFAYHPAWVSLPIVNTDPDSLVANLRMLILDPGLRLELGKRGRAYVEKYHSYEYIGGVFDKLYRQMWFGEDWGADLQRMGVKLRDRDGETHVKGAS